jgi:hypothetical protein
MRISLIEGDACDSFRRLTEQVPLPASVLVIGDSSHTFENTLQVLMVFSPLVKPGGYDDGTDTVRDVFGGVQGVRYLRLERRASIGEKRNRAAAEGAIIAHRDDDDWYALMMTGCACYAVTSAGDDHFGALECSVVRGSKPSVCGQAGERGVGQVTLN